MFVFCLVFLVFILFIEQTIGETLSKKIKILFLTCSYNHVLYNNYWSKFSMAIAKFSCVYDDFNWNNDAEMAHGTTSCPKRQ